MNYYNEHDPGAAAWLRQLIEDGLIPQGHVDERDIQKVQANELRGYTQHHFFCGIAGWPLALQLAGWRTDEPVWTGSCPCQDFSSAGKRKGIAGDRHLWPEFMRLIKEFKPTTIFGEQVASSEVVGTQLEADFTVAVQSGDYAKANKLAKRLVAQKGFHFHPRWVDGISADLGKEDYSVWFGILGAHSIGAPHIRQRLFWMAHNSGERLEGATRTQLQGNIVRFVGGGSNSGLADTQNHRYISEDSLSQEAGRRSTEPGNRGPVGRLADAEHAGHDRSPAVEAVENSDGADGWVYSGGSGGMGDTSVKESQRHGGTGWQQDQERREGKKRLRSTAGVWSSYTAIPCGDNKTRRIEPGLEPLVDGIPRGVVPSGDPRSQEYAKKTGEARVMRLKGYGNAIVPAVAAEFIISAVEAIKDLNG
jgi:DNA (cytosine-5)-methyltransferase 1